MVTKKETSDQDFEALLEKYDYKFQKGDLVKGIVCGFDSQGVLVDIGAKTVAVIPTYEAVDKGENIEDKFKKGDNLILTAFGAGFAWGAIYIKWGYDGKNR